MEEKQKRMIPFEQQVCSFESVQKLKELGVKQESCFYWVYDPTDKDDKPELFDHWPEGLIGQQWQKFSAFTVAELGEMLPFYYASHKEIGQYRCFGGEKVHSEIASTEVEAKAKMLIYLLENKLITL